MSETTATALMNQTYRAARVHPGRLAAGVATEQPISVRQAWVYLVYHYIEVPVRRMARRVAFGGQWHY